MKQWYWIAIAAGGLALAFGDGNDSSSSNTSRTTRTSYTPQSPSSMAGRSTARSHKILYVTGSVVNVRSGPGVSHQRIRQLKRGTSVRAVETRSGWVQIEFNGLSGWMSARYLSQNKPRRQQRRTSEPAAARRCHPSYEGKCVPIASDVDCADGSGNGPAYVRGPVRVVGRDVYGLDRDRDGVGCE